mgnify:CR=1 FL=1
MKKLLIIFILFAVCLTFAGCTNALTEGTNTVGSSDALSVTTQKNIESQSPPPICMVLDREGLAKLRSFNADDKEGIFGILATDGGTSGDDGIYGKLFLGMDSEEGIYEIIDFLRTLKIPKISGAEITRIYISPEYTLHEYYSKKIEIVYTFNSPAESNTYRVLGIEYTYASGVTFEQMLSENSKFGGEITVCKNGIKAAGLTERTTNAEDHRTICFAELEGCPVKITFGHPRKDESIDYAKPSEPINAELLDILKNDVTFTSFFANDASDQTAD